MKKFKSTSAAQTQALGEKFGKKLKTGDVVLLIANLGAGKTTFTQGLARGMGIKKFAMSPTFIIAQTFEGRVPLHHLDFYRTSKKELIDLGVQDYFSGLGEIPPGVAVIEWADLCKEVWPPDHLLVEIKMDPKNGARVFSFSAKGPRSKVLLQKL